MPKQDVNFRELLSSKDWDKAITPDFVKELSDDSALKLAYALKDSPKGKLLLADTEIIATLLEKNPATAPIIAQTLQETEAGQELLRKNKFVTRLLEADKSGEVRKTIKEFTPIPEGRIQTILNSGAKLPGKVRINAENAYYQR
jgi:hypothetical protein